MTLPESMSRIVIVGTKDHVDEAIEVFYDVSSIHLIDHTTDADEGFTLGTPRPYSPKASERLLKVRALEKELGVDKHTKVEPVQECEIRSEISSDSVELVEKEVMSFVDKRNDLNQRITELNATKKNFELLSELPIDLDLYTGYKSVYAVAGTAVENPTKSLEGYCDVYASFKKKKEPGVVAVFTRIEDKDKALSALSEFGFSEIDVPKGTGHVADALAKVNEDIVKANTELETVQNELKGLFEKHKRFLKASEEELSIDVEKGEIPVRIATSEYAFVMDGWVPTKKVETVKKTIEASIPGSYVSIEETRGRTDKDSEGVEDRFKEVPSKMTNGKVVKEFEYVTKLMSSPRYQEIDPSILVAIFLPLFFGLMVGDVGYAIPFIIIGAYGLKTTRHKDWRAIATVLFFGGIWAFIFGFFFYGEALGMHFVSEMDIEHGVEYARQHMSTSLTYSWADLLNLTNLPDFFSSFLPGGHGVGKIDSSWIGFQLKLAVYIGIIHLSIGYLCAIYNKKMQKGFKEGFMEKGGWLIALWGMVFFCLGLTLVLGIMGDIPKSMALPCIAIGLVLIILSIPMNWKHEGMQAVLELPGLIGGILSYTRLAAIGMSKAGMALAFNYIVIHMFIMGFGGVVGWVLGGFFFVLLHLMIWTLAILSAGLHGLRLQLVELMGKFFEGGGVEYDPLSIKRKQTVSEKNNFNNKEKAEA